ncbi:RNA polymerase recycling motor HelD [Halalkalibacter krulwichiae]|uniref:Helicase IV n=1 Tax=Halalkalibacter krulwichiae TaxID=199441 RepID=A0A1X9MB86_9BACI|nr:RNA polymerase recycling motor HelD [Halalkalibacter krulwichiae]ARK30687.1 Helicase IV [Halalkalibacter krulwichiae]
MNKKEWKEEQERVDFVLSEVIVREHDLKEKLGDVKTDVINIRKNFWEDVTVNLDNAEEAAETFASIKQQAELMSESERRHKHDIKQLNNLHKLKHSPYFGRIDFLENGESNSESIYIGTSSFVDQTGMEFYVYDWRAPISSLYYDYGVGAGQYDTPMGTIAGDIKVKKQFIIKNGKIQHMFHTGITIGDELLQEVLGNQSNSEMKNIVATIQKEQNQIIRNEKGRLLIVQGVAGSGKTSAALQRVAYLLYRYRDTLSADEIVLFSPNPLFTSYISTVLPELGEENMQQTTFQSYLQHRLGSNWRLEDQFDQMEYVLHRKEDPQYAARIEGIKVKSSIQFINYIDHLIDSLSSSGMIFKDIIFREDTLFSKAKIEKYFYRIDRTIPIPNRLHIVSEQLLKEVRAFELNEQKQEWVDREIELLDIEVLTKVHNKVEKEKQKESDVFYQYEREQELLRALVVKRKLKRVRDSISQFRFLDVTSIYLNLFKKELNEFMTHWPEICSTTVEQIKEKFFLYEDVTPYLYLKGKLEGFQINTLIKHVFIDEAQDYSPFQFAFIRQMFPRAKWTVLGDFNQSIYAHSNTSSFLTLETLFLSSEIIKYDLKQSYRSTSQIIEFAKHIVQASIEPFNRNGEKPKVIKVKDKKDLILALSRRIKIKLESYGTVAVICKTKAESETLFNALHKELDVRLITKDSAGFDSGVLIIPSYLAKGVEFDAVIIPNVSSSIYANKNESKLLYTICTRAMHSLELLYHDTVSPLLLNCPSTSFEKQIE